MMGNLKLKILWFRNLFTKSGRIAWKIRRVLKRMSSGKVQYLDLYVSMPIDMPKEYRQQTIVDLIKIINRLAVSHYGMEIEMDDESSSISKGLGTINYYIALKKRKSVGEEIVWGLEEFRDFLKSQKPEEPKAIYIREGSKKPDQ
jgi:hypothetical protein